MRLVAFLSNREARTDDQMGQPQGRPPRRQTGPGSEPSSATKERPEQQQTHSRPTAGSRSSNRARSYSYDTSRTTVNQGRDPRPRRPTKARGRHDMRARRNQSNPRRRHNPAGPREHDQQPTPEQYHRWRTHTGKVPHPCQEAAEKAVAAAARQGHHLKAYGCPYCPFWHTGHPD
jgi:hypothetical protein